MKVRFIKRANNNLDYMKTITYIYSNNHLIVLKSALSIQKWLTQYLLR